MASRTSRRVERDGPRAARRLDLNSLDVAVDDIRVVLGDFKIDDAVLFEIPPTRVLPRESGTRTPSDNVDRLTSGIGVRWTEDGFHRAAFDSGQGRTTSRLIPMVTCSHARSCRGCLGTNRPHGSGSRPLPTRETEFKISC